MNVVFFFVVGLVEVVRIAPILTFDFNICVCMCECDFFFFCYGKGSEVELLVNLKLV